jgi:hypothetical protein
MKYILIGIGFLIIVFVLYQLTRVHKLIRVSKKLVEQTSAFSVSPEQSSKRFLIIGDSLGVGVGASLSHYSIAGRLSRDNPQAEIQNLSVSGLRIKGGLLIASSLKKDEMFDIVFIQVGANDVVHLTSLNQATRDLEDLLNIAKLHSKQVVYFNSGSLGSAPLFPHPIDWFYAVRSNYVYSYLKESAQKSGVTYVDLYYASDFFHVTDAAYELWYQKIRSASFNLR